MPGNILVSGRLEIKFVKISLFAFIANKNASILDQPQSKD